LSVVKTLQPGSVVWDRDVKGFGVRRQRQKIKYILKSRIRGKDHWFTIGTHGAPWTPDSARQEARRKLGEIAAGKNLAAVREQQRSVLSFADVVDRFLEEHRKKVERRTITEYERLLRRHAVPALVANLHHSLAATPRQADLLLSVLSKLMGWAAKRGLLPSEANPCRGIDRYKENKRERFLSAAELSRLGEALREAEQREDIVGLRRRRDSLVASDRRAAQRNFDAQVGLRRLRKIECSDCSAPRLARSRSISRQPSRISCNRCRACRGMPSLLSVKSPGHTSSTYRSLGIAYVIAPVSRMRASTIFATLTRA
jgi:hypothetical protein